MYSEDLLVDVYCHDDYVGTCLIVIMCLANAYL